MKKKTHIVRIKSKNLLLNFQRQMTALKYVHISVLLFCSCSWSDCKARRRANSGDTGHLDKYRYFFRFSEGRDKWKMLGIISENSYRIFLQTEFNFDNKSEFVTTWHEIFSLVCTFCHQISICESLSIFFQLLYQYVLIL